MGGDPRLAQCLRCKAYTLLGEDGGVAFAVDVAAADRDGYVATLVAGRALYRVEKRQNGGQKVLAAPYGTVTPSWGENGAQTGAQRLHAEHEHPARLQRPVKVAQAQAPAVCDTWRSQGWRPPRPCPRMMGSTSILSCAICEAPPFAAPLRGKVQTGISQEGRSDQICEIGGPDGARGDGPGGHPATGGPETVDRQPWVRPDVGRQGEAAASLDPGAGGGEPACGGPRQPHHPGQSAQQSAGGHSGGVQPEQGPVGAVPMGNRGANPEIGPVRGPGEAFAKDLPPGHLRLPGGGAGGPGGVPSRPTVARQGSRIASKGPAQSPQRGLGEMPHVQPAVRCHICDRLINQTAEPFTGIHHGRWVWAVHEECP